MKEISETKRMGAQMCICGMGEATTRGNELSAMISNLDDLAQSERQALIASVQQEDPPNWPQIAVSLSDKLLDQNEAVLMAIHWLDQGASGRAREELLRVLKIK